MDPPAPTRRKRYAWLAIIITAVAFVVAILTSRRRRQWLPRLLPRRRLVAFPPPIRIQGLTEAEAEARRLGGQDNTIHLKPPRARREIWRENVYTIFNLNLVGLAFVQFLLSRPLDAFLSLGVMCLNIGLQVTREVGAQHRLQEIEQVTRARATVIREERARSIDPSEIVLGDVLVAGPGDLLFVDDEVLGDGEIVLDKSRLTGQSRQVARRAGDKVYAGSLCISGRAAYEAQRVGNERKIASTTREGQAVKDELTALERTVDRMLRILLLIVAIFAVLLLAIYFGVDTGIPGEVFDRAASLIFNIAPSSLFFMIVLTYTAGTARLAKLGALVHRAGRPVARPGDMVDFLVEGAAGIQPALDDLDTVEVGAVRISQRPDREGGCCLLSTRMKIRTHRNPTRIAQLGKAGAHDVLFFEVPTGEDTDDHPRPYGRIDLTLGHGIPDRLARVLPRPDGDAQEPSSVACSGQPMRSVKDSQLVSLSGLSSSRGRRMGTELS